MLKNGKRELAYIVKVDAIEPIIGSDNCECAKVGGWNVMVRKGSFKPGDLAVYFEIDSKVPETKEYDFLIKKHYKIKTQKYTFGGKGCFISQGLLMALDDFVIDGITPQWQVKLSKLSGDEILEQGFPLTEELGVTYSLDDDNKRKASVNKYARMKQRNAKLFEKYKFLNKIYYNKFGKKVLFFFLGNRRDARASFWCDWVAKTDEERIQNLPQLFPPDDTRWIATEKIDGSSTTFTMKRGKRGKYEFYVCSRNVCFDKPDKACFYDTNIYIEMAEKYHMEEVLKDMLDKHPECTFVTIQGETYGEGVQKKTYGIKYHDFAAFNLIFGYKDIAPKRFNPLEMTERLRKYNVPCVPIVAANILLLPTIDDVLDFATGESILEPGTLREGLVYRDYNGEKSFKAVSNEYLLSKNE